MSYDVVITGATAKARQTAAQVLEDTLGFEPAQARELTATFPSAVIARTSATHAEIAAEQLRDAGFTVEIVDRNPAAAPPQPSAPVPSATDAGGPERSEQAHVSVQRRMFDTRAIRSLEQDLEHVDLGALTRTAPNPSQSFGAFDFDDGAPGARTARAASAAVGTPPHAALPDVDALFRPTPSRVRTISGAPHPQARGAVDGLDDLFQAPGPRGAETYFTRKTPDGRGGPRAARGEGKFRTRGGGALTHGTSDAHRDSVPTAESIRAAAERRDRRTLAIGALVLAGLLVAAVVAVRLLHF